MDHRTAKVLVIDDEAHILKTIGICLDSIGFQTYLFSKPQEALQEAQRQPFDLAFVDLKMAPLDGMEVLANLRSFSPETTVILITAHGSIDSAVEAIKKGAYHYLQKPFEFKELQIFAQKAWEYHQLRQEVQELRKQVDEWRDAGDFITRNRDMLAMLDLAGRIAESNISVLIEGESGTGKELVAQFIHRKSQRADKPFIRINCAALPEELLESELFGHVKGAFTGAVRDRRGRFELADGGTIFLDEIAEVSSSIQAKLLRVIQSKEFELVGESVSRKVDVRIIAATNRNLDEALKEGTFREDLFYRLNAVRLKPTPLRERPEDIPLLVQHFITKLCPGQMLEVAPEAMAALRCYRWNGNVRELENVIERAVILARQGVIELPHLPEEVRSSTDKPTYAFSLEEMEKMHIKKVLQHSKDYDEAARVLGIDPATLWRKRKKYQL
ncbi:MAG TPA: sigma-54 dependent transcriptional regulator [bacterium]|nr:sigma-54 dependent transcriptional regulator [bacterium]HPN33457.1 sigma-54 dependent transcriptional regulator [bacterium]